MSHEERKKKRVISDASSRVVKREGLCPKAAARARASRITQIKKERAQSVCGERSRGFNKDKLVMCTGNCRQEVEGHSGEGLLR